MSAKLSKAKSTLHHVERLISALGNPSEWEHRGEWFDAGETKCACGQVIRYAFKIHHSDGCWAVVGSTCVGHFEVINPALHKRLIATVETMQAQILADKAASKATSERTELDGLKAEFTRLTEEVIARLPRGCNRIPPSWDAPTSPSKQYKTVRGYANWYKKANEKLQKIINELDNPTYSIPY